MHDFEHGGLTNDFLVNSLDLLAVRYNDRSPLENHHLAAAFTLMRKPEYDFICNVPKAEFDKLRKVGNMHMLVPGSWCWVCRGSMHFSILPMASTARQLCYACVQACTDISL